jgi:hypothetical protein
MLASYVLYIGGVMVTMGDNSSALEMFNKGLEILLRLTTI